jgi:hypothetical protein
VWNSPLPSPLLTGYFRTPLLMQITTCMVYSIPVAASLLFPRNSPTLPPPDKISRPKPPSHRKTNGMSVALYYTPIPINRPVWYSVRVGLPKFFLKLWRLETSIYENREGWEKKIGYSEANPEPPFSSGRGGWYITYTRPPVFLLDQGSLEAFKITHRMR